MEIIIKLMRHRPVFENLSKTAQDLRMLTSQFCPDFLKVSVITLGMALQSIMSSNCQMGADEAITLDTVQCKILRNNVILVDYNRS